eukprot:2801491-Alexandrium_andersonii.AAC.1
MSASLVGSEMCIRDSPESPQPAHSAAQFALVPSPATSVGSEPSKLTVSYTHLTLPTICSV